MQSWHLKASNVDFLLWSSKCISICKNYNIFNIFKCQNYNFFFHGFVGPPNLHRFWAPRQMLPLLRVWQIRHWLAGDTILTVSNKYIQKIRKKHKHTFIQTKDHCSHSINDLILNKNKTVQIIVFHTKNTLSTALPNLELKQATKMQVSLTWGTYLENKTRTWSRHSQSLL